MHLSVEIVVHSALEWRQANKPTLSDAGAGELESGKDLTSNLRAGVGWKPKQGWYNTNTGVTVGGVQVTVVITGWGGQCSRGQGAAQLTAA